ncbi:MAG TPA: aminotransferase class I/II-fold pyridoxal phosphate-dependent enzyme [Dyella sp.]|uniref:trans-sulfuration enzyme family protein n=1 Tax=Dyella sp. TaxID=1869338 RepID=UPI002F95DD55
MDIDWIINHLGEDRERYHGAVAPPLLQSAIFAFPDVASMRAAAADEFAATLYTRGNNPTVATLRTKVAALEGAEDALVFASGAGAMAAGVIACVASGDHVVCVQRSYTWTKRLLNTLLSAFGVAVDFVDGTESTAIEQAIRPETRLIVLESPTSLTFELQDLQAVAELARRHGALTLCDNSCASPLGQSPLALGIDLAMHSATKYLNGHSDIMAGVLCGSEAMMRKVFAGPLMTLGAVISPHDAWLMLRGLRTLPLRMQRCAESALHVATWLEQQPQIARVNYPQLPSHPQYELAQRQMRGGSGVMSVVLDVPDLAAVERFCNALKRFLLSVSWGGYESLVWPMACALPSMARVDLDSTLPASLVRLSIGLEDPEVLIADLAQALARV